MFSYNAFWQITMQTMHFEKTLYKFGTHEEVFYFENVVYVYNTGLPEQPCQSGDYGCI